MKRKGISLIVLIITIVVIIILATAIIVNLAQTNIVSNSEEAVFRQDIQTFKDELSLYIADKYTDALGEYDYKTLNASSEEVIEILPSVKGTKYEDKIIIVSGKVAVNKNSVSDDELKRYQEIGVKVVEVKNIELKDADSSIQDKYNFVASSTTVTGGAYGNNTVSSYGFIKEPAVGDIVYMVEEYAGGLYSDMEVGYYEIIEEKMHHTSPYYIVEFISSIYPVKVIE